MQQESDDNSWDQDVPQTMCQLQFMTPKQLLKIIDILKQQGVSTVKMQFGFISDSSRKFFLKLYKEEQNNEYQRDIGPQNEYFTTNQFVKKQGGQTKKGCTIQIGSHLRAQVFLKAYEKQLKKIENNSHIKIYKMSSDIYIQSESENKVKIGEVQLSQIMYMYKHLHMYVFYRNEELWNIVVNSQQFRKRLQKIGIFYHQRRSKVRNVAFYSFHFLAQQIQKQVMKQNSFNTRILKLYDPEISWKNNNRIFDLVVKSIRSTIDKLRQIYQCNLEVNKANSCFVLHSKAEIFQTEPVQQISKVVSHLFIISFSLRNSRAFINLIRRNSKKYAFVNVSHYKNIAYCCIDRTKIQNKKELLFIFNGFLEQLNQRSVLTIHLKPNCVLMKNSTLPQKILDLTQQCKLDVQLYEKVLSSQSFNIKVKTKLFIEQKKNEQRLKFSKFLVKLLMLKENQKQVTSQQLNESLLNNSMIIQDNTDDTRGNRNINGKKYKNVKQSNNVEPVAVGRGNRNTRVTNKNDEPKQQKQKYKQKQKQKQSKQRINKKEVEKVTKSQNTQLKQQTNQKKEVQKPQKQIKQIQEVQVKSQKRSNLELPQGCQFIYQYTRPHQHDLSISEPYQKMKKDRNKQLQNKLQSKLQIENIKIYKLKLNSTVFKFGLQNEGKINKQRCYCVQNIIQKDKTAVTKPNFISFKKLVPTKTAFIIQISDDGQIWIPTHMIQKF